MYAHIFRGEGPGHPFRGNQYTNGVGGLRAFLDRVGTPDGGFTYQPKLKTEPTTGFVVSPYPSRSFAIAKDKFKLKHLADYVRKNDDMFSRSDHYLGAWHDPNTHNIFLDISIVTDRKEQADEIARKHDQKAYFDLSTFSSVEVNRAATSGGVSKMDTDKPELSLIRPTTVAELVALYEKLTGEKPTPEEVASLEKNLDKE